MKCNAPVYFSKELDQANRELGLAWKLRITNNESALNEQQIQSHFRSIDDYSKQIEQHPQNASFYFGRAMDYMLVQDYANALQDINKSIDLNPNLMLSYFARAVVRSKQLEFDPELKQTKPESSDSPLDIQLPSRNESHNGTEFAEIARSIDTKIEYDAILKDYETIYREEPRFLFCVL